MAFSINERLIVRPDLPVSLSHTATLNPGPVCVGGVGGSGTRLVATILERLGFFVGNNINVAKDNFDLPLNHMLNGIDDQQEAREIIGQVLKNFEEKMHADSPSEHWAWKVPGSFYWLDYINCYFPEVRYIHLIRNGLDMAYSGNTNQVRNWGGMFGIRASKNPTPREMLEFWVAANQFAIEKAGRLLNERFLMVSFDQLCLNPEVELKKIIRFLGRDLSPQEISEAASEVKPPKSLNRYRNYNFTEDFGENLMLKVAALGFPVAALKTSC